MRLGDKSPVLLGLLVAAVATAGAQQPASVTGVLSGRYGDPRAGGAPRLEWVLRDDGGRRWQVELSSAQVQQAGGFRALQSRRVTVSGTATTGGARPRLRASAVRQQGAALIQPAQYGAKPYALLLCRFSDVATEPMTVAEANTLLGGGYPNLDDYYRELSDDQMNLSGSQAFGWFQLPQPRSFYVPGATANLDQLAADCTAAADASVDFSAYHGVIIQVNADLDGPAWGGSAFMTLDGVTRSWPMTWMPLWATQVSKHGVYAHEVGHSLGLPHSSGPYSATYDSDWDVMSNSYLVYNAPTNSYVAGQTISYHKDLLGWIPSGRRVTAAPGSQTLDLDQSEFPSTTSNALEVVIPIGGTTQFYTVEARRHAGYDTPLPLEGVIIHKVTPGAGVPARVVDPDNNGDPNDAGAVWLPGETFSDGTGISMTVHAATASGWTITVVTPAAAQLLTVLGAGTGNGTITSSPSGISCTSTAGSTSGTCSAGFADGTNVTLTATSTNGTFTGWSGACSGTGSCVVAMTAARSVTATFAAPTGQLLTVTPTGTGGGTVSSVPAGVNCVSTGVGTSGSCSATFGDGSNVQLVATAAAGSGFAGWSGACNGTGSCQVTMSGPQGVTARFDPVATRQLTVSLGGTGAGEVTSTPSGIGCTWTGASSTGACDASFTEGTTVTLTSQANTGAFIGWGGACSGSGSCSVTMDQARTVTGTFDLPVHALTITAHGTGSGTVESTPLGIGCVITAGTTGSGCIGSYTEGVSVTLVASATAGTFTGWGGACSGTGNCVVAIDQAKTVSAGFELPVFTVTVQPSGSGAATLTSSPAGIACAWSGAAISGACSADYVEGTLLTISRTTSGTFEGWGGGCSGADDCQLVVGRPSTVSAAFIANQELVGLAANALTGTGSLNAVLRAALDAAGNHDGGFDIGDLVALVDRTPGASVSASVMRRMARQGGAQ